MQIDHFGNITYDYPNRNSIYELLNKLLLFQNYLFYKLNNFLKIKFFSKKKYANISIFLYMLNLKDLKKVI
jgi:hypothetical protein|tara:strand:+ start:760 stop:972 length:213 start_codon:yes stop_codon:yes gene_type:complete